MLGKVYVLDDDEFNVIGVLYHNRVEGDQLYGMHKLIMHRESLLKDRIILPFLQSIPIV